jgi:hypothetical protein
LVAKQLTRGRRTSEAPAETASPVAVGEAASTLRVVPAERAGGGEARDLLEEAAARRGLATAKAGLAWSSICIRVLDSRERGAVEVRLLLLPLFCLVG